MIENILIAIDGGGPARSAIEVGVQLAQQLHAKVLVLHVVDVTAAFRPELGMMDESLLAEQRVMGQTLLDQTVSRIDQSLQPQRALVEAEPAEAILATARKSAADLIVLGSDSRGRLAHFLLGSTADAVIRKAPCPVLTVREIGVHTGHNGVRRAAVNA
jgi:nucleotide-binding universal stress UspA family protein